MSELEELLKKMPLRLEDLRQKHGLPSLSVAVAVGRDVVWQGATGWTSFSPEIPARPEMVYPLGSVTKVFVVTMLMQLLERGVVALNDPLVKFLPEYGGVHSPFEEKPATTLRQLAAHTSGLPRDAAINFPMNVSLGDWEFSDGRAPLHWYASTADVLASLSSVELELPADTAKVYSNLGIMLLGIALERACGENIRAYMAKNIFTPLGMTSAGFLDEVGAWDERFPCGFGRSLKGEADFVTPHWQLGAAIYTGGIFASAADLARFCAAFAGEKSPILRTDSILRMIHPAAMGDTNLGWWRGWHAGHVNYGHAGAHVGFISAGLFAPEFKLSVAVQTNRWNPIFDTNDSTEIARELLAELIPGVERDQPVFNPAAVDLNRYTGKYRLPGNYATAEVSIDQGQLTVVLQGAGVDVQRMLLVPVGPHQFGPAGTNFTVVSFQADASSLSHAMFRFQRV
jgi:CubicO group peptidase (beta-lactamase class C family)